MPTKRSIVSQCIEGIFLKYLLFVLLSLHLFAVDASLTIEKDVEQRARIALIDGSEQFNPLAWKILLSDFKISGHFLSDTKHYTGDLASNYIPASLKNREYVIKYKLSTTPKSTLWVRLLEASSGKELFQKRYRISMESKLPFLLHKAISDINNVLHYSKIDWINRYVIFSRYVKAKQSEIVLADYTFSYQKVIVRGGLNLFPIWADAKQKSFYYTSYASLRPTLYRLNIYTGSKEKIVASEGMVVCSDVNHNGSKILLTLAPQGQADIYELTLSSKQKRRITQFHGIDVNAKYSKDEESIVFVSNRLGHANIFKKSLQGSAVLPVVFHGKNNNACDSYGDKVVYTSRESSHSFSQNSFNLYLTSTQGGVTRPLTTTGSNQFPRFSRDGSIVQFIKYRGNSSSIGYINLETSQSLLFPFKSKKIQSIAW